MSRRRLIYVCDVACIIDCLLFRYDFDKDGLINSEDVDRVLSYIPLNTRPINTYTTNMTSNNSLTGKLSRYSRDQRTTEDILDMSDPTTIS